MTQQTTHLYRTPLGFVNFGGEILHIILYTTHLSIWPPGFGSKIGSKEPKNRRKILLG